MTAEDQYRFWGAYVQVAPFVVVGLIAEVRWVSRRQVPLARLVAVVSSVAVLLLGMGMTVGMSVLTGPLAPVWVVDLSLRTFRFAVTVTIVNGVFAALALSAPGLMRWLAAPLRWVYLARPLIQLRRTRREGLRIEREMHDLARSVYLQDTMRQPGAVVHEHVDTLILSLMESREYRAVRKDTRAARRERDRLEELALIREQGSDHP